MGCWSTNKKNIVTSLSIKKFPSLSNKHKDIVSDTMARNSNEFAEKTDDDISDSFKDCIKIKVNADTTENMLPVWIEKNVKIKLFVKGKWSLLPGEDLVSYKGHVKFNHKHRDLPIGALIGRVHGGDYFEVNNGMTYQSNVSGPIYLFANNSRFTVDPQGSLNVFIQFAQSLPIEIIEEKLGWNINELDTASGHEFISENERMQIIFINKLRSNPRKFAEQYLIHLKNLYSSYQQTYETLINYTPIKVLKPSKSLYLAAKDHAKDIGENGTTGHSSTDGAGLKSRIVKYSINPTYFVENCSFGIKDPLTNILQLVVDDDNPTKSHRLNFLNEAYDQIGISILPHASYKFVTIQVFGTGIIDKKNLPT